MRMATVLIGLALASAASAQPASGDLAAALHLRPDQRAAYARFQNEAGPEPPRERQRAEESRRLPQMTTPERIDWTTRQLEEDLADLRRQGPAVKAFYAQLTPDQKRTFDQVTAHPEADGR